MSDITLEQLAKRFNAVENKFRSEKDRAVSATMKELKAVKEDVESLQTEVAELREMLRELLVEEISYGKQ